MEDNVIKTSTDQQNTPLQFTPEAAAYLLKAAKWGKFLAILGFIILFLIVIAGVMMSFVLNLEQDEMAPMNMPLSPILLSLIYIVLACIFIIPVFYLNSFCNQAIKAVKTNNNQSLTASIRNLKRLFAFIGLSTVIVLCLYSLFVIIFGMTILTNL